MINHRCVQLRNRAKQVLQKAKEKTGAENLKEDGLVNDSLGAVCFLAWYFLKFLYFFYIQTLAFS